MSTAAAIRKRPAADQDPPRVDGGKKPRYTFRSIHDYEKLEELGHGACGQVLRARDRRTGKKVALKWLHSPDFRAIALEAGLLGACRGHPSIIQILDVVADAETGDMALVMELVGSGCTLREDIYRPLSEDVARRMMRQLLDAANKIHGAGIVHRDFKPENVLVSMFGGLKVCDFGVGDAGEAGRSAIRGVSCRHADLHLTGAAGGRPVLRPGCGHVGARVHHGGAPGGRDLVRGEDRGRHGRRDIQAARSDQLYWEA